jgi:hypothetical protein
VCVRLRACVCVFVSVRVRMRVSGYARMCGCVRVRV